MIGIYNTITIGGVEYPRPSDFELVREDIYAGEYETCTGKIIADRIGWRYADMTLTFDTLSNSLMQALTAINGAVTLGFTDSDGAKSEQIVRQGFADTPTRFTGAGGEVIWKDIQLNVRFINAHND